MEKSVHAVTLGVKSGPSKAKNGLCCYSFLRFSREPILIEYRDLLTDDGGFIC